jgi:ADP-ribose pyrophosphatase
MAGQISVFGPLYEVAGFAPHHFHVAEATVNRITRPELAIDETGLSSHWLDIHSLKEMILKGELQDAPSLAAFSIYLLRRSANSNNLVG